MRLWICACLHSSATLCTAMSEPQWLPLLSSGLSFRCSAPMTCARGYVELHKYLRLLLGLDVLTPWWDVNQTIVLCFPNLALLCCNYCENNTLQWITWLGGRWRTQLTARRNVNCRTCEHRHFERILRSSTSAPCLAQGRLTSIPLGFPPERALGLLQVARPLHALKV